MKKMQPGRAAGPRLVLLALGLGLAGTGILAGALYLAG